MESEISVKEALYALEKMFTRKERRWEKLWTFAPDFTLSWNNRYLCDILFVVVVLISEEFKILHWLGGQHLQILCMTFLNRLNQYYNFLQFKKLKNIPVRTSEH